MKRFYQCTDLFPEAIFIVDSSGLILAANQSARSKFSAFQIINGETLLSNLCAEPASQIQNYLRLCSRTRSLLPGVLTFVKDSLEALPMHAEGALFEPKTETSSAHILLKLIPKKDAVRRFEFLNKQIEQLSVEVERRRKTELQLLEQREQIQVTLSGIGDAVIATDMNTLITFINPSAEAQTGWAKEEAIGKPLADVFKIVNEKTRQLVESPVNRVIREKIIVGLANHTILIRKDGSEIHIDDSGAPIFTLDGTMIGVVLVFHDITERRHLEHQIEARTQQLEDEHRRKDEFLAMLSHELRNPLAPIKAALQIQSLPHSSPETNKQAIEIMSRQVDHLTRLVDELLDMGRITTGKITLKEELLEVASILYRAAELSQPLIRGKGQHFSLEVDSEPLYINGDLQRLTQVVGNVLNNASKYTQVGGSIFVTATKKDNFVEIRVKDNGMGILPSVLPTIFTVFTQAERALARSEGGLGIGLALVHRLVEQHSGTVVAFSEGADKGSEFCITLPLVTAPATPLIPSALKAFTKLVTPSNSTKDIRQKLLVVDDNPDAAEMLRELLQLSGHQVMVASNGEDAIASALINRPTVIFLDIGLPGMDGYAVVKALRSKPETERTILIALTGYGQQSDIEKTKAAGFNHHLVKPADMEKINGILAALK